MADQTVVEKMSELQVDPGKKVILESRGRLYFSYISQLAASLACGQIHAVIQSAAMRC